MVRPFWHILQRSEGDHREKHVADAERNDSVEGDEDTSRLGQTQLELDRRSEEVEQQRRGERQTEELGQRRLEADRRSEEVQQQRRGEQQEEDEKRKDEEVVEKQEARRDCGKPTASFNVGDIWKTTTEVLMRRGEDLEDQANEKVADIPKNTELEILEIGLGPTGKRLCTRNDRGLEGWVSVTNRGGEPLLTLVRQQEQLALFVGAGQTLGGSVRESVDPRAVALAAAERRRLGSLAHGVGEKKAKQLSEQMKRDSVLKKINEAYAKSKEEIPLAMQSASLEVLQKHLDYLQHWPESPSAASSSAARPQAQIKAAVEATEGGRPAQSPSQALRAESVEQPLHPSAVAALNEMRAHPGLSILQQTVEEKPMSLLPIVQSLLEEHPVASGCEPRLGAEIAQLLREQHWKPQVAQTLLASEIPQERQATGPATVEQVEPQATGPATVEQVRMLLLEQAKTVCCLNEQQLQGVLELESMGFEYERALEAYLACDRNQDMAANFLLENSTLEPAILTSQATTQVSVASGLPASVFGSQLPEKDLDLSISEWEAVQRIQELGFDKQTSLKAYIACGRDEERAANRLLT